MNDETAPGLEWNSRLPVFTNDLAAWEDGVARHDLPDHRTGALYDMDDDLRLAVEVALITGRPLLVRGEPGSGKSSLAAFVARNLDWRYYEKVVTSATRAEDFLWGFDAVRRLSDAQVGNAGKVHAYVDPGALWWALDPESAERRGLPSDRPGSRSIAPAHEPFADINASRRPGHAVVLIDELDKADPDVPNGLLVPLGSGRFRVTETGSLVDSADHDRLLERNDTGRDTLGRLLVIVTTNEERQLPPAFVRRCIVYSIDPPDLDKLRRIALLHVGGPLAEAPTDEQQAVFDEVGKALLELREEMRGQERRPSVAEYLDAVNACLSLNITPSTAPELFERIRRTTLHKPPPEHL